MIEIKMLFYILLIHFLGDFALQTHEQATNKSIDGNERYLTFHVLTYSLTWFIASIMMFDGPYIFWKMLGFGTITFFAHFITDWTTSRIGKKFFEKDDYHNGFVVIGADQVAHYVQLVLTYQLFV